MSESNHRTNNAHKAANELHIRRDQTAPVGDPTVLTGVERELEKRRNEKEEQAKTIEETPTKPPPPAITKLYQSTDSPADTPVDVQELLAKAKRVTHGVAIARRGTSTKP